ncbi:MAG: selenide, water dikinase SelD [Pseudomonadota bacterium]
MNTMPLPLTRDIVLVGGGHSHALVLRKWGMAPLAGVRLTVINPGPTAPYSGMLPGHVAGHYPRKALDIDLVRLARFAGARLILGAVDDLDLANRTLNVPGRPPIGFDLASLDVGITSSMPGLPGFSQHAVPAKPLGAFAVAWQDYLEQTGPAEVAVIGGGVAGTELALAMAHALKTRGRSGQVTLLDRGAALSALQPRSALKIRTHLGAAGVVLREHVEIAEITANSLGLASGEVLRADFVTGAAGARPYEWLSTVGLDEQDGFVTVRETLQTSDPDIFAVGDCAHMGFAPRPKAGVYAVRQAPVLYANLRARAMGQKLHPYPPQDDYLKLISLGKKSALAERFGRPLVGPLMWRWKDRIDQRFMDRFRDLPVMTAPALPKARDAGLDAALGDKPMCGGCGAKVGRDILEPIQQAPTDRPDIDMLPGDDAALLTLGTSRMVLTTDHLRAFVEDPVVMTRIAAVHALGDIWAMGAVPKAALVTLILPPLSAPLQARTVAEIMSAARLVMGAAGAEIVGGHTTTGAELTIGFSLTGDAQSPPITLAGGQPGDALILTKPLGSGVIMAADMAGLASGADVAAALEWMQRPQGDAARHLAGAHAMTDVTGFGLAGHLEGICRASGTGAMLDLARIPLMSGAAELAAAGTRSTLFADNRRLVPDLPDGGVADLLYDPQTGGGLLAAVPAASADDTLSTLREHGCPAAQIGQLTTDPMIRVSAL